MHSFVSPDPIGIALAYLPVALAVFAAVLAISSWLFTLASATLASRRRGGHAATEPEPQPA